MVLRLVTAGRTDLGHFFGRFFPVGVRKIKIFKKRKKRLEILPFYTSVPKIIIIPCMAMELRLVTDGRKDGRMEKVIYRGGAPPKNYF